MYPLCIMLESVCCNSFCLLVYRYYQHPNVTREQPFHSAAVSDNEKSSPSTPKPSEPSSASKPASKVHHKPHAALSIGNVAAELMASNSQFLKASQESNKTHLDILQSQQKRAEKKLGDEGKAGTRSSC